MAKFNPSRTASPDLDVDDGTISVDADNDKVGIGTTSPKTKLTVEGTMTLKEQASAESDTAAYGQLWVKSNSPNDLFFTNDAGNDVRITNGSDLAAPPSAGAVAADDINTGDAEISLATSAGNITIDAQGNNTDIIFKGTDASADITMLTLDGSEAGAATFNSTIAATNYSGSGKIEAVGDTVIGGNLNVSGSTTIAGQLTSTQALTSTVISASSHITAVGNATVVGTLNVTGNADFNGTITCDDSITIDSVTITDTEAGYLDGLTLGTVAASKVITVDSNKDFSGHRNVSGSGVLQNVGNAILGGNLNVTGNIDCNGTITCDDSLTIDSITITDTELAYLDGLTLGAVAASKVVTVTSDKDFGGHRNMSGSGVLQNVGNAILGGDLNVTGTATLAGVTNAQALSATVISASSNLTAVGNATVVGTLNVTGNADFNGTITCDDSITIDSTTITDTELAYLDGLTLGTVAASKVVTVDSNKDFAGHRNMSGSGVLQNVGNTILGGNLNVTGNIDCNGTVTCDDSLTIDSVTITDTELAYLDGLTLGAVAASKVITVTSDKDFGGHRNMSGSGVLQNVGNAIIGGNLSISGSTILGSGVAGAISGSNLIYSVGGLFTSGQVSATGSIITKASISGSGGLQMVGNTILGGNLLLSGAIGINQNTPTAKLHITAADADTTNGIIAYFEGPEGANEINRIVVNAQTTGKDSGMSFMEGGGSKWTMGNDGSDDSFHLEVGFPTSGFASDDILTIDTDGAVILNRATAPTATGGGIDAVSPTVTVHTLNGEFVTTIMIDIGAGGIISSAHANDVIGEDGVANAYLTRITDAVNGIIYRGEMSCIEVPTTGDPNINLAANTDGTLAEDADGSTEHTLVTAGGAWTKGLTKMVSIPAGGITNDYLYLTHAGTVAGEYDAGKFMIRLYGANF